MEDRILLSLDAAHVFARFDGDTATNHEIPISIASEDFALAGNSVRLGFAVSPLQGSSLDPAAVEVQKVSGSFAVPIARLDDTSIGSDSLSIYDLRSGEYVVNVFGEGSASGEFELAVFLVGDADGDHMVTVSDGQTIRQNFGTVTGDPGYRIEADANLDGRITGFDYAQWRVNRGDSTDVRVLTVTALLDPASDTGVFGDNLVNQTPVNVVGLTLEGAEVSLDEDGDGFDDGTTIATAIATTNYSLAADLVPGDNTLRVEARDSFGQSAQAETVVTLDAIAPTVVFTSPVEGAVVDEVVGENIPVEIVFSEAMIGSTVLAAVSVSGNVTGTVAALGLSYDEATGTLSFEIPDALPDTSFSVTVADSATDLAGNGLDGGAFMLNFTVDRVPTITAISPANGEEMVSLTREAIVRFSEQIDPATITHDAVQVIALGQQVPGRLVVSSTERFVTFFPDEPWNASTEVRVRIDGNQIVARDGDRLDADGDRLPGGVATANFRTLPITRIPGTNVFGFVFDSFSEQPIVGATIRIDAFPEANVVTDENGRFELVDMPAPEFFVHIDGSTAINAPQGFVYSNVGKPFHSVPGQTVQIEMDREPFDIFLPPMALGDVQPLSATDSTDVGFGDAGKANLVQMFPGVDPTVWELMQVNFAPGSALDDFGNPATEAAIIPVPPDRIPAPLPPTLNPQLVISIQAGDATNFDVPAPIMFPNLDGLAPGEKSLIFSFDHDAGEWIVIGTGTVSEDGLAIVSDPGVGILAPGWHFVQVGTTTPGKPCNTQCLVIDDKLGRRIPIVFSDALLPVDEQGRRATASAWKFTAGSGGLFFDNNGDLIPTNSTRSIPDRIVFFLPDIITPSTSPNDPGQASPQGKGKFSATLTDAENNTSRPVGNLLVRVEQGWGNFAVPTSLSNSSSALAVAHVQQRLHYLGFPGQSVHPIKVTGTLNSDTLHAIGLFNAAVKSSKHSPSSEPDAFINNTNAPRWVKVPVGGLGWKNDNTNNHNWGTSWAVEVIREAGIRNSMDPDTIGHVLKINDLSLKNGGFTASHPSSHQAGMDVDVKLFSPGGGPWYSVSTARATLHRTAPFWEAVAAALENDGIDTAQDAFENIDNAVIKVRPDGSSVSEQWILDQFIINVHTHRGSDDAYDRSVRQRVDSLPSESDLQRFDRGLDELDGKRGDYNRDVTVGHIAAFSGLSIGRILFNDPIALRLLVERGAGFGLVSAEAHNDHFHVDVFPEPLQPTSAAPNSSFAFSVANATSVSTTTGFGNDDRLYYRFELANGFEIAGRSNNEEGSFSEILTPNVEFTLTLYRASTNRSAVVEGRTNASGRVTNLGTIILDQFGGPDTDGDGLPDVGEKAIGTSATLVDTDGDGITDDAEITQGLDPLDNRGFPTGIISSLPLPGSANEVVVEENIAYVATGSHGLAIVDVSQFDNPILLGQVDLPGFANDVDVDPRLGLAAVATISGGVQIVDIFDPMLPSLLQTVAVSGSRVEVADGVAYVSVGGSLTSFDLLTGAVIETVNLGGRTITDIASEGTFLYTMDLGQRLQAIEISGGNLSPRGSVILPEGSGKLFVGNGIAYASARNTSQGGFATADVSNPDNLFLISGTDAPFESAPGTAIVSNGSGLGLLIGRSLRVEGDPSSLQILDISDPSNTYNLLADIGLPTGPNAIAVASGIAFIANGRADLQVINYLPFDNKGLSPMVSIATPVADADLGTPGLQVEEGTTIPVQADVFDDVQVQRVELLVNGEVVRSDVSFPFEFFAIAPNITPGSNIASLQVRAVDTGGNATLSNTIEVELVHDLAPPVISNIDPADGTILLEGLRGVQIQFLDSLDPSGVTADSFTIFEAGPGGVFDDGNDVSIALTSLHLRDDDTLVQLTTDPLGPGFYEIRIAEDQITDRAGNPLGDRVFRSRFTLVPSAFIVNSLADTVDVNPGDGIAVDAFGNTTLRAAVMEANALASSGTTADIVLGPGIYRLSIAGTGEDAATQGDLDIRGNVRLVGAGEGTTVIDAAGLDRVFHVFPGVLFDVSDLTITGGSGVVSGGGVLNEAGSVQVVATTLSGNTAVSVGGGVSNESGTLFLTDTTFSNNSTPSNGGAVNNLFGTVEVTASTFVNNTADLGGAIVNNQGSFVLSDSTLSGNTARRGGAILQNLGTLVATNSTFSANVASSVGGAIVNDNGDMELSHSELSNNSADWSGGISNEGGSLVLTGSTLSGNSAVFNGGGVNNFQGTVEVTASTFVNNTADLGGAIVNDQGSLTVAESLFSQNTARRGGAILNNLGTLVATDSFFSSNIASAVGGAIVNDNGNVELSGSELSNNSADRGGGIYNNQGSLALANATLSGNVAAVFGGAIRNLRGTVELLGSTLSGNSAGSAGGGINNFEGPVTLKNTTLSNNSADFGGGIGNSSAALRIETSTFSGNTAAINGGAINNASGGNLFATNSTFSGNSASGNGGAINIFQSLAELINDTFSNNTASVGNGIWNGGGRVPVRNTIIVGGVAGSPIGDLGNNLIGIDPMLGPLQDNGAPTLTHALLPGSPAIDAGNNNAVTVTDQRGIVRIVDGDDDGTATVDIGAFELMPGRIGGATRVDEQRVYSLGLAPHADNEGWVIDWGDGTIEAFAGNPNLVTHVYPDGPATHTIVAREVLDGTTLSTSTIEVNVVNVGPTLSITGGLSVDEGSTYTLNLSSSDAADDTITSWTIDWGDGNVEILPGNPSSVTHVYADGLNHFNIFATATDEDGTYVANEMLVSSFNSNNVVRFAGGSGEFLGIFGEATNLESGLDGAIGMVFGPDGDLYVAAELSQNVHRFDSETGEFLGVFGDASFAASGLDDPIDLEFGPDGDLYVTSALFNWDGISERGAVLRYDGVTGAFKGVFGEANARDTSLDIPLGLTFGPGGDLFVATRDSDEVLRYDGVTGNFLGIFGDANPASRGLGHPTDVVFGSNGDLFVPTRGVGQGEVLRYAGTTGVFLGRFGDAGPENGVVGPHTVLFGPDGAMYVPTAATDSVLRFDATTGEFLSVFASAPGVIDGPVFMKFKPLRVTVNDVGPTLTISGDATVDEGSPYTLNLSASDPNGVTINGWTIDWGDGNIEAFPGNPSSVSHTYVDGLNHFNIFATATDADGTYVANDMLVTGFSSDNVVRFAGGSGALIGIFGEATNVASGLDGTIGMTFGPNGNLFVAGELSHNVLQYDGNTGTFLGVFGDATLADSDLRDAADLEFGPDGDLYVTSALFDVAGTTQRGAVLRYDGVSGEFKGVFGEANALDSSLDIPVGMTFAPNGDLFVASRRSDEVLLYDGVTGAFLGVFGDASFSGSGLDSPGDVIFGPNGDVFVPSRIRDEVLRYDGATGAFLGVFGDAGPASGLDGSLSLVFGPDGAMYVVSTGSDNVLRFDATNGDFLGVFASGAGVLDAPLVPAFMPVRVTVKNVDPTLSVSGDASVEEGVPYTLNLSATGDPGDDTIISWTVNWGDGTVETIPGNPSSVDHLYAAPGAFSISALATDEEGTYGDLLYGGTSRGRAEVPGELVILDPDNQAIIRVGDPTTGDVGLSGLALDSTGALFGSATRNGDGTSSELIRIDSATGELLETIGTIRISDTEPLRRIKDLAVQPGTDVLYGVATTGPFFTGETIKLFTIDTTTGIATLVGDTGVHFGSGLGFAPDGTLYLHGYFESIRGISRDQRQNGFFTINPSTAEVISSVPISTDPTFVQPWNPVFDGLAVRPTDGDIFSIGDSPSSDNLYVIDPVTGFADFVAKTGGSHISDLVFVSTLVQQVTVDAVSMAVTSEGGSALLAAATEATAAARANIVINAPSQDQPDLAMSARTILTPSTDDTDSASERDYFNSTTEELANDDDIVDQVFADSEEEMLESTLLDELALSLVR